MAKTTQPNLFDDAETGPTNEPEALQQQQSPSKSESTKTSEISFSIALLALGSIRGLGQKGLQSLVAKFNEDVGTILTQSHCELAATLKACDISGSEKIAAAVTVESKALVGKAEEELKQLKARNIHIVSPSCLPDRLRSINGDSPKWLFVEGDVNVLTNRPVVAVVGTRSPTEKGLDAARIITTIISAYPVLLVSGLAEGIDCQAHCVSLQQKVKNLAFLGHGINLVFPQTTSDVRHEILMKGGAVVSEYMPDQHFQKRQFVERNRLQAALADIVIPVEAKATSGTAHTIRFARRYSRQLIGMTWQGANGIVDDLRANNDQLINIFTSSGQKQLDALVRGLLAPENADAYPFKNLERAAQQEFSNRDFTQEHLNRLLEAITRDAQLRKTQEPTTDGKT